MDSSRSNTYDLEFLRGNENEKGRKMVRASIINKKPTRGRILGMCSSQLRPKTGTDFRA